ncbi:MAG: cytochrome P450 [Bosea sp.]|uniref:cytochrome P450 n=1 Tax=Bosea sp. (in: a-proteobacteria) TaxID=1871050 RepID=UPI001AD0439E|nr:cytochrome P450 [Bosea sp. (in: a-proteobacteria)]MBN9468534.1 cytochrome P450 [Bosea sp. (in: a-proteobacteria)]
MRTFELPSDPAFWQDPAPFFQDALASGGGLFTSASGLAVLGYDALFELGRDPRLDGHPFPEGDFGPDKADIHALLRWGLFALTGPQHRALRQAVIGGLSTRRVEALRATLRLQARELHGAMLEQARPDLIASFVAPLAARAFCALTGIDPDHAGAIAAAIAEIGGQLSFAPAPERLPAANQAAWGLLELMHTLEADGSSALITDIAARLPPASRASAAELVAAFALDAVETTTSGVFCVLDCLIRQPQLHRELAEGRYTLAAAVQEAFRLTSPTILTARMTAGEIPWRGETIPTGTTLVMWWPSANLDGRAFARPAAFEPVRPARRHLAFGIGGHGCLGRQLASLLAEEAARVLLLNGGPRPVRTGETRFLPRFSRLSESAPIRFD